MAEIREIQVETRQRTGTGGARATRRAGKVPGIIYGGNVDPQPIAVEFKALEKAIERGGFFNSLIDLVDGGNRLRVLPRDVQFDVVTDWPLHVDFMRIAGEAIINIEVPVEFINEEQCHGLRRGGVLNIVRHEIELHCRADSIPEKLVFDLAGLDIGDSIHISAITLPDGVTPTITDRDFTVATIAAPSVMQAEADEDAEAAEAEGEEAAEAAEAGEAEGEAAEGEDKE